MKNVVLLALIMLVATAIDAQERMKIEMTDGTTQIFDVKKVQRIFFEGKEIVPTTGSATDVTSNSVKITYSVSGVSKVITTGIIISTSANLTHDNYLRGKSKATQADGTYSVTFDDLSPSTTYYYRAYSKFNDEYSYGNVRSFTTTSSNLIYQEPYTNWGASISQTKSYMSGYTIYDENATTLSYYGKDKESLILYSFNNSKLVSVGVAVAKYNTTESDLDSQLRKNYTFVGKASDGDYLYYSSDGKTLVILSNNDDDSADLIAYIDYNWYVNQSETVFEVPYTNWGATRSTVKSAVAAMGYTLYSESTQASDKYYLIYSAKNKEVMTTYFFDSSQRLSNVLMPFLASDMSLADMRNYLTSTLSYSYEGVNSSSQYYYATPDGKSYAIVYSTTVSSTEYTYLTYIQRNTSYYSPAYPRMNDVEAHTLDVVVPDTALNMDISKLQQERIIKAYEKRGIDFLWP